MRSVVVSTLNRSRRDPRANSKKQKHIQHADAEVVNDPHFVVDIEDKDEDDDDEDYSEFVHVSEEFGDTFDDDDEIIIALDNEDNSSENFESVMYVQRNDDEIAIFSNDGSRQNHIDVKELATNTSSVGDVNFNDDEYDDEDSIRTYDDDGVTVIDVQAPQKRKKERARTRSLVESITTQPEPGSTFSADAEEQPPIELDESAQYVRTVVRSADTRKAENILVLRVSKLTYITSFIIIATGNSTPQLRAIANLVEEDLTKVHGLEPRRVDGVPNSGWILLDCTFVQSGILTSTDSAIGCLDTNFECLFVLFSRGTLYKPDGDFLINIFSPEQRRNYNLEGLWSRAEVMDLSDFLVQREGKSEPEAPVNSLDDWLEEN